MATRPATSEEWREYYERADRRRAIVGDPFRRLVERQILHERLFLVGCALCGILVATAFTVWAGG